MKNELLKKLAWDAIKTVCGTVVSAVVMYGMDAIHTNGVKRPAASGEQPADMPTPEATAQENSVVENEPVKAEVVET